MGQLSNRKERRRQEREQQERELAAFQVESTITQIAQTSGPLPDPETLVKYNQAMPGLADRIVKMAETESEHRRDLEEKLLAARIADSVTHRVIEKRGQGIAGTIALVSVCGGFVLIGMDHQITGSLLSGGTILTLVGLFIYGRERKPKEQKPVAKAEEKPEH